MTDQEINEAVARKLGWKVVPDPHYTSIVKRADGSTVCFGNMPNFCHSIVAAWEIVEKERYALFTRMPKGQESEKHDAWVCNAEGVLYSAKTAPMAICLAFLKMEEK